MAYGSNMNPSASKRFENDRTRAAQSALIGQAAKQSIPNPSGSPRPAPQSSMQPPQQAMPKRLTNAMGGQPPALPQMPQMGAQQPQQIDPIQTMKNEIELEQFLGSPQIQQAIARSRLRKYFKRNNPSGGVADVASDALNNLMQGT
jgi:hypothetical protein